MLLLRLVVVPRKNVAPLFSFLVNVASTAHAPGMGGPSRIGKQLPQLPRRIINTFVLFRINFLAGFLQRSAFEISILFFQSSSTKLIHNGASTPNVSARIDRRPDWKRVPGVIALA